MKAPIVVLVFAIICSVNVLVGCHGERPKPPRAHGNGVHIVAHVIHMVVEFLVESAFDVPEKNHYEELRKRQTVS